MGIYGLLLFCLLCISFWLVQMNNLFFTIYDLMEFGRYPVDVYHGPVRAILVTVLPLLLLSNAPVQLLLRGGSPALLAHQAGVLLGFAGLATVLWRAGLRHYQGAGG